MNKENKTAFQSRLAAYDQSLMRDQVAMQVASSGKPRQLRDDPMWMFTRLFGTNDISKTVIGTKKEINGDKLIETLKKEGWELITSRMYYSLNEKRTKPIEVFLAKEPHFLVSFDLDYRDAFENQKNTRYEHLMEYGSIDGNEGEVSVVKNIQIYHISRELSAFDASTLEDLIRISHECSRDEEKGAEIGIISSSSGDYYVKNFSLEGKTPPFTYPDLHYGDGFEDFHNKLINRLKDTTKGLVLLHGDPGTGKTQYIRVLLKELAKINKSILYAPPSLSASLTEPETIEFISDWIIGEERDCILLIEDAEPLLEIRAGADGRSTGISNLLNMTDGLLNDILGLTVIATFNTHLSKIDPALLRPQRLVARKEFKKMPKDRLEKLATELKIPMPDIKYPASLAEFYAVKNESEILIHSIEEEVGIGFNARR